MLPLTNAENIPALIPQVRFTIIDGGGHNIVYTHPERIAEAVRTISTGDRITSPLQ
jgi:pimeloyl-ACP methyl ester carboxylesterase